MSKRVNSYGKQGEKIVYFVLCFVKGQDVSEGELVQKGKVVEGGKYLGEIVDVVEVDLEWEFGNIEQEVREVEV